MLTQWLDDFPMAVQAFRENHQVARQDSYRFAALRRHQNLAFQDIRSFSFVEVDRELGYFFLPNRPIRHT